MGVFFGGPGGPANALDQTSPNLSFDHLRAAQGVGDLNGDGRVDGADLTILLSDWGASGTDSDLNGSGMVGGEDLAILLANWTG